MVTTILDCYTDEPAGLGVPPYLGTYPRYLAGYLKKPEYITIDDLRFLKYYKLNEKKKEINHKTNIKIYNLTKNIKRINQIIEKTNTLFVILGIHTPGKYLSAIPGTLKEVSNLIKDMRCEKILVGPAFFGTQLEGGKLFEKNNLKIFNKIKHFEFTYQEIAEYAIEGAKIVKQIPDLRIIEIETGKGCPRREGCSFCTEPIKNKLEFRKKEDIINEIKRLYNLGCRNFRLGKQSDLYAHPEVIELLSEIRKSCPEIEVLHIDNVNPKSVLSKRGHEITKAIVKYCTPGNVAAFGIESFDPVVYKENNLNCTAEEAYKAIKIINKYGAKRGENGMPSFLPGINILFGLKGESKETHKKNMYWLKKILKSNLLLRRINIRQVTIFKGTPLYRKCKNKFIKKNKKHYWKWRDEIRKEIDLKMLKRLVPKGTILNSVKAEIYDGNTTFARQIGTYPLIIGIKKRIPLKKYYSITIKEHMLRSVIGEIKRENKI